MALSPSNIGGVPTTQTNGTPNDFVSASSANPPAQTTPDTSGGTSPTSVYHSPATSKATLKAASKGQGQADVFTLFPTTGFVPAKIKDVTDTVMADWYRDGRPLDEATGDPGLAARMIQPFEYDEKRAAIRLYGYPKDPKTGQSAKVEQDLIPPFTKFILESVQEQRMERSQIVETFGDWYIFYYGERPSIYSFSGTLMNTRSVNWLADFKFYYDNFLRGTKAVEQRARLVMTYGGRQVEGFMNGFQTSTDAGVESGVKVSFSLAITREDYLSFSDDAGYFIQNGKTVSNSVVLQLLNTIAGKDGKGLSDPSTSKAHQAAANGMNGASAVSTSLIA